MSAEAGGHFPERSSTMSFVSRPLHRTLLPVFLLASLLAPLPLSAWPATAPFGETIRSFVQNAYLGVGISPSCVQQRTEADTLTSLLPTTSTSFEEEARRFVSTLIETLNSFTNYNSSTSPYFEENPTYTSRYAIPNPSLNHQSTQAFVIDLYHAFLQRDPDLNGLFFWTSVADDYQDLEQGNKQTRVVLDAFGTIPNDAEFTDLVHSLTSGFPICCPTICPSGFHYDCTLGECVSNGGCGGHGRICDQ
jgi:hypothetical protein